MWSFMSFKLLGKSEAATEKHRKTPVPESIF